MKRFAHVWGLVLGCFLAGSSVGRSSDAVWNTGPFCEGCTLTNITFYTVQAFDAYTNQLWAYASSAEDSILLVSNNLAIIISRANTIIDNSNQIESDFAQPGTTSNWLVLRSLARSNVSLSQNQIGAANEAMQEAMGYAEDVRSVKSAIALGAPSVRAEVATACESGEGCCCQCPDYTSFLQTIIGNLEDIQQNTTDICALLESLYYWLCDLYADGSGVGLFPATWGFIDSLAFWLDPDSYDATEQGINGSMYKFARYVANLTTNTWAFSTSLYGPLSQRNPFTRTLDSASDPVAHWLLDIGTMWQQLLYEGPVNPGGYASGPVAGWRDFALTKNVHPTNTSDNALWVRSDSSSPLWVQAAAPVYVQLTNNTELTPVHVSVSAYSESALAALSNLIASIQFNIYNHAEAHAESEATANVQEEVGELEDMDDEDGKPEYDAEDQEASSFADNLSSFIDTISGLVPEQTVLPAFKVNPWLDLTHLGEDSGTPTRDTHITIDGGAVNLLPETLTTSQTNLIRIFRFLMTALWYVGIAFFDWMIAKYIFRVGIRAVGLAVVIVNGDLSSFAKLFPRYLSESVGAE